jgi:acetyl-CoA synthetase
MSEKVSPEIEALLKEDRNFSPTDEFRKQSHVSDPSIYERAAADPEAFWAGFAKELEWITPWSKVLEWNAPDAKWFVGGTLNISANCLRSASSRTC